MRMPGVVVHASLVLTALTAGASPLFVTPNMVKRNGLTDEQYQHLWSIGANPRIDQATARNWIFRASRYENVKEWLADLGRTNDFAKLAARVPALAEENDGLVATNARLRAVADDMYKQANRYYSIYTNRLALSEQYYESMTNQTARAERAEARIANVREFVVTARDAATLPTTKAIWQKILDRIDGKENGE